MSKNAELIAQLNALLRLTNTEIMIAETRRAQAATDDVERELAVNADKGRERARLLTDAIRTVGGRPDIVGVAAGRVAASAKATAEQGQDVVDALLGDLAVEHELFDRTRLASMLAQRVEARRSVVTTLERLEQAHSATIEWLHVRLGEIAVGGPVALRPTPLQSAVGVARRLTWMPARQSAALANRSIDTVGQARRAVGEVVATNAERMRQLLDAGVQIWTAGRDAGLKRSEELADERGATSTAQAVNRTRRGLGVVDADELPIRNYDGLTVDQAVDRLARLRDVDDVRTVLAYETANKARKGVLVAARDRVEELSAELATAS